MKPAREHYSSPETFGIENTTRNMIDLRELENGDEIVVIMESGEEFSGMVTDREFHPHNPYSKGYIRFNFEGGFWDQVKDRVEHEVLTLRQNYTRTEGKPIDLALKGIVWEDEEPHHVDMGDILAADM